MIWLNRTTKGSGDFACPNCEQDFEVENPNGPTCVVYDEVITCPNCLEPLKIDVVHYVNVTRLYKDGDE